MDDIAESMRQRAQDISSSVDSLLSKVNEQLANIKNTKTERDFNAKEAADARNSRYRAQKKY